MGIGGSRPHRDALAAKVMRLPGEKVRRCSRTKLIQAKLGHFPLGVTRRYIGITADEIENVENPFRYYHITWPNHTKQYGPVCPLV